MLKIREVSDKKELIDLYRPKEIVEKYEEYRFFSFYGILSNLLEREIFFTILKNTSEKDVILEVATGTGRLTRGIQVPYLGIAIDTSFEMLRFAKSKSFSENWHFVQANGFKIPFADNSVSLIVTFRLLRHLTNVDRIQILSEFNRILKKDGIILFDMPNPNRPFIGKIIEKIFFNMLLLYNLIIKKNSINSKVYDDNENKYNVINELKKTGFNIENIFNVGNYYSIEVILDYLTILPAISKLTRKISNPLINRFYMKEKLKLNDDRSNPKDFIFYCRKEKN
ncbi:MAG: class I SAM-dependent methyltransferase [Candidatus Methanofastidiosum sp.]|nr:class I SAM-dependent methyltransferase [Methanofastidiosum sp.]